MSFILSLLGFGRRLFARYGNSRNAQSTKLSPQTFLILALCVACVFFWLRCNHIAKSRDKALSGLTAERKAHAGDVELYKAAQVAGEIRQRENIRRVEIERAALNERREHELEASRSIADTRYGRLQRQADTYRSASRSPDMSAAGEAACLAYSGTSCEGISPLLKAAQDNTDQLVALIAWAKDQSGVATSPE